MPAIPLNTTVGSIIKEGTINITGDLTLTFVVIFIVIVALGLMMKIPIEWLAIALFPLLMTLLFLTASPLLKLIMAFFLLMFAVIFVRNFFLNG